jgi:hypothetical protein
MQYLWRIGTPAAKSSYKKYRQIEEQFYEQKDQKKAHTSIITI